MRPSSAPALGRRPRPSDAPLDGGDIARFGRDGFLFPLRLFGSDETAGLTARFRAGLLPLWHDPTRVTDHAFQTHPLFPWLDRVVRHPRLLDALERLLGPDLLLRNSGFVVKPPRDPCHASWHQDLTYWGSRRRR